MKNSIIYILTIFIFINPSNAQDNSENPWSSARPDGHAPISVMGDHYHKKGEFMFSYRYMPMWMNGNLASSDKISDEVIYQSFMVAPQEMRMDMHMLGVMYAPANRVTLAAMLNYISNSMDLRTRMSMDFTTTSSGLGDISVSALIKIFNQKRQSLHANVKISIPTGNIDQRDATPMSENAQLAYPMQLGSGTWDPSLGITYLGQSNRFSWGIQSNYKFRIGENPENYTLGNQFDVVGWGAIKASDYLSFSTSFNFWNTGNISGVDADLNPMMMPLFNTANSGRSQLDLGLGGNLLIPTGKLKNLRFGVEVKFPIHQSVTGIQMKNGLAATFGLQYAIGHHH